MHYWWSLFCHATALSPRKCSTLFLRFLYCAHREGQKAQRHHLRSVELTLSPDQIGGVEACVVVCLPLRPQRSCQPERSLKFHKAECERQHAAHSTRRVMRAVCFPLCLCAPCHPALHRCPPLSTFLLLSASGHVAVHSQSTASQAPRPPPAAEEGMALQSTALLPAFQSVAEGTPTKPQGQSPPPHQALLHPQHPSNGLAGSQAMVSVAAYAPLRASMQCSEDPTELLEARIRSGISDLASEASAFVCATAPSTAVLPVVSWDVAGERWCRAVSFARRAPWRHCTTAQGLALRSPLGAGCCPGCRSASVVSYLIRLAIRHWVVLRQEHGRLPVGPEPTSPQTPEPSPLGGEGGGVAIKAGRERHCRGALIFSMSVLCTDRLVPACRI